MRNLQMHPQDFSLLHIVLFFHLIISQFLFWQLFCIMLSTLFHTPFGFSLANANAS